MAAFRNSGLAVGPASVSMARTTARASADSGAGRAAGRGRGASAAGVAAVRAANAARAVSRRTASLLVLVFVLEDLRPLADRDLDDHLLAAAVDGDLDLLA